MGREISIHQVDNYPKATVRPARHANGVPQPKPVAGTGVGSAPSLPKDSFEDARPHDADLHQAQRLRQQALLQNRSGAASVKATAPAAPRPSINVPTSYPTASTSKPARNPGPRVAQAPAPARPAPAAPTPKPAATRPTQHSAGPANPKAYQYHLAVIEAANKRQIANHQAAQAKKAAAAQASKNPSAGKVNASKATVGVRGLGTAAGLVSVKQGYDKIRNGNAAEGAFNMAQGGVATASEGRGLYYAAKGLQAPVSTAGKALGRTNVVLTAGMAAVDGRASYQAYKAGNAVEASERAGSAVLNGLSAFPPTAALGAVGSVLDYAMAKSGADETMVNKLNASQNAAYQNTSQNRQYIGRMLLNTPTANLRQFDQKNRHHLAQGITGLHEIRQQYAERGDSRSVELLNRHIIRIRQGLAGN